MAELTLCEDSSVTAQKEGGAHSHESAEISYVLEGEVDRLVRRGFMPVADWP